MLSLSIVMFAYMEDIGYFCLQIDVFGCSYRLFIFD